MVVEEVVEAEVVLARQQRCDEDEVAATAAPLKLRLTSRTEVLRLQQAEELELELEAAPAQGLEQRSEERSMLFVDGSKEMRHEQEEQEEQQQQQEEEEEEEEDEEVDLEAMYSDLLAGYAPAEQSAEEAEPELALAPAEPQPEPELESQSQEHSSSLRVVDVTFTEAGTLGLRLSANAQTGKIEVLHVNPGTQAERHPELRAGLTLQSVGGVSVVGKGYEEVLGMISVIGPRRPLAMGFAG